MLFCDCYRYYLLTMITIEIIIVLLFEVFQVLLLQIINLLVQYIVAFDLSLVDARVGFKTYFQYH